MSTFINFLSNQFSWHSWIVIVAILFFIYTGCRFIIIPIFDRIRSRFQRRGRRSRFFYFVYPISRSIFWILLGIALHFIAQELSFQEKEIFLLERLRNLSFIFAILFYGIFLILNLKEILETFLKSADEDEEDEKKKTSGIFEQLLILFRFLLNILFWAFAILSILRYVFGVNISTWLAGLGILGLGVSLAMQDTFRNIFGSLVLLIDRPFQEEERILFSGIDGVVKKIGIRSTTISNLDGYLVTIPNSKLADDIIQNIDQRPHFKRIINIGITYDTPMAKVEEAMTILKNILSEEKGENAPIHNNPNFTPKIFFKDFGDFSLNFIVIYWYSPADDYWAYLEHAQGVNLNILNHFNNAGIDFAFPSQTLYLSNDSKQDSIIKNLEKDITPTDKTKL